MNPVTDHAGGGKPRRPSPAHRSLVGDCIMWLKRMLLTGVLAIGVGGVSLGAEAVAADRHESPWERVVDPHGPIEAVASSEVRRVHSLTVKSQTIEWKVDVQIRGEKGRACVVEVEFCNAAGNPYIGRDGKPVRFQETVTPDSDDYKATGVTFQLWAQMYRFYYGRQAGELTFRVVVRDRKSDQVIN